MNELDSQKYYRESGKNTLERPPSDVMQKQRSLFLQSFHYILIRIFALVVLIAILSMGTYIYLVMNPDHSGTIAKTLDKGLEILNLMPEKKVVPADVTPSAEKAPSTESGEVKEEPLEIPKEILATEATKEEVVTKDPVVEAKKVEPLAATDAIAVPADIPSSLAPFYLALKAMPNSEPFLKKLTKKQVGEDGAGALPFLANAVKSSNAALSSAAKVSLQKMNTPEAKKLLEGK